MHHRPASPPLTARVTGALTRWGHLLRALLRVRTGRLVLAGVVTTAVTSLVLILPVVSGVGSGSQSMVLDSSSWNTASPTPEDGSARESSAEEGSPVVMGVDGRPIASSSFPGADAAATTAETADPAPRTTDAAPAATPETADAPDASAPATSAGGSAAPAGPSTESSAGPSSAGPSSDSSAPERPTPAPSAPPASAQSEESQESAGDDAEDELLELLDEARDDCDELDDDSSLAVTARAHSAAMRDAGLLTPLEGGPAGSIAQGGTDAEDVLSGWLADPAGRATILDCDRSSVGIGIVDGPGGPWWTLLLT